MSAWVDYRNKETAMHPNPAFRGTATDTSLTFSRSPLPARAQIAARGSDAYISPGWDGVPDQVPTWTCVALHLRGLPIDALRDHADSAARSGMLDQRIGISSGCL